MTDQPKTYSAKHNAARAARNALMTDSAPVPQEGEHFTLTETEGGWTWAPVHKEPEQPKRNAGKRAKRVAKAARSPDTASKPSKGSVVLELLKRPQGATVADIAKETDWQKHTIRAFISTRPKALGLTVSSEKTDAGRTYHAT